MKKYIRNNRSVFIGAIVCVLIGTISATILQFFKGNLLDYAIAGNVNNAIKYAALLIGFILLEIGFHYCYDRLIARFVVNCTRELKADLFESILRRDYVTYKAKQQGEYIAKYTNDVQLINEMLFSMLPRFVEISSRVVLVSIALFWLDWRIAIVAIFLLTMPLYIPKLIEKSLHSAQMDYVTAVEQNLAMVTDWLSGFEIVKNFSIERSVATSFSGTNDYAAEKMLHRQQLGNIANLITSLMSYISYFIILALAAYLVLIGDFSAGNFFVAVGMVDQLSYPLISLSGIIGQLVSVKPTCREMEAFLAEVSLKEGNPCNTHLLNEIRFDQVGFSYEKDKQLLHDFNLRIERDKRYLLKGPSGCGKTTVINLLLRYYDTDTGRITVDGEPIDSFFDMYPLITVVRQDAILFHDTLRNNLTMFQDIPDDKLIHLLKSLELGKYASVSSLDAVISEGGSNYSGGEKKRICLARALLRDTEMLILDEPLGNLDDETARAIESLLLSIRDRTLLVVSHQFSSDKIGAFDTVLEMSSNYQS